MSLTLDGLRDLLFVRVAARGPCGAGRHGGHSAFWCGRWLCGSSV